MPSQETYIALWYRAQASEIGTEILINEEDRKNMTNDLYRARDAAADPDLKDIRIVNAPTPKPSLWLVKATVELDD